MVKPAAANPTNARQIPQTPNTVQTRFLQSITDIPENAGHVGEFGVGANHCCTTMVERTSYPMSETVERLLLLVVAYHCL